MKMYELQPAFEKAYNTACFELGGIEVHTFVIGSVILSLTAWWILNGFITEMEG